MQADVEALFRRCSDALGVTMESVRGAGRPTGAKRGTKTVALARQVFWWVARRRWHFSYPELGRMLCDKRPYHHSTVMYAERTIELHVAAETRIGKIAIGLLD